MQQTYAGRVIFRYRATTHAVIFDATERHNQLRKPSSVAGNADLHRPAWIGVTASICGKFAPLTATLEELDRSLMLLGCLLGREGAEVAPLSGFWILFARIEAVLARLEFSNHDGLLPDIYDPNRMWRAAGFSTRM
jgi:hypothetical protein